MYLVLEHLVSDKDEGSGDAAAEEDDEPAHQRPTIVDAERQCLQTEHRHSHNIIIIFNRTLYITMAHNT